MVEIKGKVVGPIIGIQDLDIDTLEYATHDEQAERKFLPAHYDTTIDASKRYTEFGRAIIDFGDKKFDVQIDSWDEKTGDMVVSDVKEVTDAE